MAPVVRRISTLRAEGKSQGFIAGDTGVNYSTVLSILGSRIYLGEVQMNGEWFPGCHEPLISAEQFAAAHRGRIKGRPRGTDLLSSRVRCGLCRRLMAIDQNGEGRKLYRCHHRGQGCAQPRRTNTGLYPGRRPRPAAHGDDGQLQAAIRQQLERARMPARKAGGGPRARRSRHGVEDLVAQRRKLLRLYYADRIGPDLFAEEEARLSVAIREAQRETEATQVEVARSDDIAHHFDDVARLLANLDVDKTRGRPRRRSSDAC